MSRKKVIVRRFQPGLLWGYLPSAGVLLAGSQPSLDLLDLSAHACTVPLAEVKYVCYVRDLNVGDPSNPERLQRKTFQARPRNEGLWLRLCLRDGELIEGLAPLDLALADGFGNDLGVFLLPPDVRGNTVRLYVPRTAIETMEVLAVVTSPTRRKIAADATAADKHAEQPDLFSLAMPPDSRTH